MLPACHTSANRNGVAVGSSLAHKRPPLATKVAQFVAAGAAGCAGLVHANACSCSSVHGGLCPAHADNLRLAIEPGAGLSARHPRPSLHLGIHLARADDLSESADRFPGKQTDTSKSAFSWCPEPVSSLSQKDLQNHNPNLQFCSTRK